jgi:transcriptional/translational regulatory protein YebC/TACO1
VSLDKCPELETRIEGLVNAAFIVPVEDFDKTAETANSVEMEVGSRPSVTVFHHDVYISAQFICTTKDLAKTTAMVTKPKLDQQLLTSELVYVPKESAHEPGEELEAKIASLVETLEENEDILRVYTTLD